LRCEAGRDDVLANDNPKRLIDEDDEAEEGEGPSGMTVVTAGLLDVAAEVGFCMMVAMLTGGALLAYICVYAYVLL